MNVPHTLVRWDADAIATWERVGPTAEDEPAARVALLSPPIDSRGAHSIFAMMWLGG